MSQAYIDRRCSHGTCEGKRHYVVKAWCTNCAWNGRVWITMGHTKSDRCAQAECPRCGCRSIQGGEFVDDPFTSS